MINVELNQSATKDDAIKLYRSLPKVKGTSGQWLETKDLKGKPVTLWFNRGRESTLIRG